MAWVCLLVPSLLERDYCRSPASEWLASLPLLTRDVCIYEELIVWNRSADKSFRRADLEELLIETSSQTQATGGVRRQSGQGTLESFLNMVGLAWALVSREGGGRLAAEERMSEGPHWNVGPDSDEDATPFPSAPGSKQAPLGEAERPAPSRQGRAHTAC